MPPSPRDSAVRRAGERALLLAGRVIPDGPVMRWVWMTLLRVRPYACVPKELVIGRGDTALQVGTPNTWTVDRLSRIVGRTGTVVIVEAEPGNAERLTRYARGRGMGNVHVVPKAAWNEKGVHRLLVAPRSGDHRLEMPAIVHDNDLLAPEYYEGTQEIEVDTVDGILDDLGISEVRFAEVAVNGAEPEVLEGMERTLGRTHRLMVKAHARDKETGRPINIRVARFLGERGFQTRITKPTPSPAEAWGRREGDVFAWRD
jgi:FkbM family methyltransferase